MGISKSKSPLSYLYPSPSPPVIPACPTALSLPLNPSINLRFSSSTAHRAADCVKATQTMFLLKACSSSHSCCLGLAGLTNAGFVLSPRKGPVPGGLGNSHTHPVPSSCFSFTFNTTRETERETEERKVVCRKKTERERGRTKLIRKQSK